MMNDLKDIFVVTSHDFLDSFRSRRVLIWLILYLLGSLGGSWVFAHVLKTVESEVAEAIGLRGSDKPGVMSDELQKSKAFHKIVNGLVKDEELAEKLVSTPPLVLFYGWLSFTFAPFLIILLCSETIAGDVSSGFARYNLFRTGRLNYAVGKAVSQMIILAVALCFSGIGAWLVGIFKLARFDAMGSIHYFVEYSAKSWIYSLPFLGLALAVSQWTRSQNLSRVLGLFMLAVLSILSGISGHFSGDGIYRLWDLIHLLTPQAHRLDLWSPDFMKVVTASFYMLCLYVLYFFSGYAVFRRRDL